LSTFLASWARAGHQTGNCGALTDGLVAGDLFVPSEAFCGEGAAQYYKPDGQRVAASSEILSSETFTRHGGTPLNS
jgi:uridine phosphorylase